MSRLGGASGASAQPATEVELIWLDGRLEHWIRFGRNTQERIVSRRTRIVSFSPGAVFAFVAWSANDFGTVRSRIDVIRAAGVGTAYTTVPFVRPGGELLLSVRTWPRVSKVLAAIDAIEAAGVDPCEAAPEHWHHLGNRIAAGERFRPYTRERHLAWLRRRELGL